jgi:DNA-binding CsgD family transcriptional regulator
MTADAGLVGRRAERERLQGALDGARLGSSRLILLAGDAGVGKSRLAAAAAGAWEGPVLPGSAARGGTAPYGPLIAALRSHLRTEPAGLQGMGPLEAHLALILPELGRAPAASDRATLVEAIRCALTHIAAPAPALVLLDDLQWSDVATLELLAALGAAPVDAPLAVVAAYRSDGLPRDHALRRLRHELRRSGCLDEIVLEPLGREETAQLLAGVLGDEVSPALAAAVHDRTHGVPFFVEELAAALEKSGALTPSVRGLELARHGEVPLPDTVRDAVLIGMAERSDAARAAAEVAAVAGETFDLELVSALATEAGVGELVEHGVVVEDGTGGGAFRHALTREALYADVPWLRRLALHREIAVALERSGEATRAIAAHWAGAREDERARAALLQAAAESEAVHAYRDAADASRRAFELVPPQAGEDDEALARHARCAELAGDLAEAASAWRELVAAATDDRGVAEAQRRLAGVLELRAEREPAAGARLAAAEAFAAAGCASEAAVEYLALANQRRIMAQHGEAVSLARTARVQADAADRLDLRFRALGIEGMATAKHGDFEAGLGIVREALAQALEHDLTPVAAELYQRLSVALYDSADYGRAQEALDTALALCEEAGEPGTEVACVTCLAFVLQERGEWPRAMEVCRELIESGTAVWVAEGMLGSMHCFQGKLGAARRLLGSSLATARAQRHYNMTVMNLGGLARLEAAEGDADAAAARLHEVLDLWRGSDDHHYAVSGLRWGASFFSTRGDLAGAQACAAALTTIASDTGYVDALAALAHAIGETALAEGDAATAAEQLVRAVELHEGLDLPFERAQIELRAGVALHAAGEREPALERLSDAYRTARRLGARPLAAEAAGEIAAMGESVARRLGRRATDTTERAGLSRRELEVVRLVAVGRTNAEVASELFLSPRTVDMHVRNILRKLDCRSRVEAAHRAGELGLLRSPT